MPDQGASSTCRTPGSGPKHDLIEHSRAVDPSTGPSWTATSEMLRGQSRPLSSTTSVSAEILPTAPMGPSGSTGHRLTRLRNCAGIAGLTNGRSGARSANELARRAKALSEAWFLSHADSGRRVGSARGSRGSSSLGLPRSQSPSLKTTSVASSANSPGLPGPRSRTPARGPERRWPRPGLARDVGSRFAPARRRAHPARAGSAAGARSRSRRSASERAGPPTGPTSTKPAPGPRGMRARRAPRGPRPRDRDGDRGGSGRRRSRPPPANQLGNQRRQLGLRGLEIVARADRHGPARG